MADKKFFLPASAFMPGLVSGHGNCLASDKIMVDGLPVGYMYREAPRESCSSGWHFFSGTETQEYTDDPSHWGIYHLNTLANYDQEVIPFLDAPLGSAFARNPETGKFEKIPFPSDPDEAN